MTKGFRFVVGSVAPLEIAVSRLSTTLAVLALCAASPCSAQTKPGEIKGVDAMGDKSRSARDGFSQAPVPREESAAKDAPNPGGHSTAENANRPVPAAGTGGTPGTEPQAPVKP